MSTPWDYGGGGGAAGFLGEGGASKGGGSAYNPGASATGGGGGSYATGGSGIVFLRWITSEFGKCLITGSGNTITENGEYSIAMFTTSGTITFGNRNNSWFLFFMKKFLK
jgi:hypothetical protein